MLLQEDGDVPQNIYKTIKIYPRSRLISDEQSLGSSKKADRSEMGFKPCVSFNTVPSYMGSRDGDDGIDFPGVQIPPEYTMEEYYDDESGFVSLNAEYFLRNQYITNGSSYGGSPPPRNLSNKAASLSSMFRVAQNGKIVRVDYPSRPAIMNDAIVINRAQAGWEDLWYDRKEQIEKRLGDKQAHFRYPDIIFKKQQSPRTRFMSEDGYTPLTKNERRRERILNEKVGYPNTPRTILCHISGRRHTWVALDWTMRKLAQNTDHIVVIANIPRFANSFTSTGSSFSYSKVRTGRDNRRSSFSGDFKDSKTEDSDDDCVEWTSGYRADAISEKLEDLLHYIAVIVPKTVTLRVSVEIVIGKTSKIMLDAMNVYTPDFCTSTTLKWERTDQLVLWRSKNLTDALCTKYPIPVFVIPVKRMYGLENSLQEEFPPTTSPSSNDSLENSTSQSPSIDVSGTSKSQVQESTPLLASDTGSTSDFSDSSSESASLKSFSKNDLIEVARKHREDISLSLKQLENEKHDSKVSKLLKKLDMILKSSLDFSLQVQNMTQDDGEAGFEQLKRVITGGTSLIPNSKKSMLDVADAPKVRVYKNMSSTRPRNSQIKFASDVVSKDGSRALGNKVKPKSGETSPSLRRSVSPLGREKPLRRSHDEPLRKIKSAQSSNSVRKVRSASNISRVRSNDSATSDSSASSGKKKGGWLSLFKGSGSRSRSTSRRGSMSSDNETINSSDSESKKRRSKLFGFS